MKLLMSGKLRPDENGCLFEVWSVLDADQMVKVIIKSPIAGNPEVASICIKELDVSAYLFEWLDY